ncbi:MULTISPECIES: translation initiation factor IF-3 [unclassified Paenibacillus]|uniref:Translation initiation factor IF-3 n=1 Tax=Paenibacillus provencensis TaxID=441151 RepID=A0ABW3PSA4_9BACL|nr:MULTISPECIES: translation initiation factor IF-3 [unclassified Paenibacillus]MCM3128945.1 translation initiation factor IF-3 [Paenibacillus sp. MER 78]SFS50462.1 translation initiation factor IF-3 [Paenibacillus sp. 453mf]
MIKNEKIKAAEVVVTGIDGEDLGVMKTSEALALAKKLKVDLVCTTLLSSPPPCRLVGAGVAKQEAAAEKRKNREPKVKEIRLTPHIEEHDYDTKKTQMERILKSGDMVKLVVKIQKKEGEMAKSLLESLVRDLKEFGEPKTGIQLSGKQAVVELMP